MPVTVLDAMLLSDPLTDVTIITYAPLVSPVMGYCDVPTSIFGTGIYVAVVSFFNLYNTVYDNTGVADEAGGVIPIVIDEVEDDIRRILGAAGGFDSTRSVTVLTATVPSSAVTVTVSVLLPVTKPVAPVITRDAEADNGVATTVTSVVPLLRSTVDPSSTAPLFTVNIDSVVILDLTRSITVWFWTLPLSAVTMIVNVLGPVTKLVAPVIVYVARDDVGVATTVTAVVPAARGTVEPIVTAAPFTAIAERVVIADFT